MIRLDAASVLLQWATGGLLFLWVTTRRREVGLGYGWLLRAVYLGLAAIGLWVGWATDSIPLREVASAGVIVAGGAALTSSVLRRRVGVTGQAVLARGELVHDPLAIREHGQQRIGVAGVDEGRLLVGKTGKLFGERLLAFQEFDEQVGIGGGLEICH